MNILYIGPYRQTDDYGILSRSYLQSLIDSDHKVSSRPLYIRQQTTTTINELFINEKIIYNTYDVLIQHAPIKWLGASKRFKKNIAIPIFSDHKNLRDYEVRNLNQFDTVIVNSHYHESNIVRSGLSSNIRVMDCPIAENLANNFRQNKINFGINNHAMKFYSFLDINKDRSLIDKILISFYTAFRCNYGHSMIMFVEGATAQHQNDLMESVKEIKKQMKIKQEKNTNDLFIFKNLSFEDKLVVHNTCDIFLNFSSYRESILHEEYARFFGNSVINTENTETVDVPVFSNDYFEVKDTQESILTKSLIEQILLAAKQTVKSNKYKKISNNTLLTIIK